MIPTRELLSDRTAALKDIGVCVQALSCGITGYSGGFVWDRLMSNLKQIEVMEEELARRGVPCFPKTVRQQLEPLNHVTE